MPACCLITGATGFVGGYLAEACHQRQMSLRTIARPGSDTKRLEELGVQIYRGDLGDAALMRKAVFGADLVLHCAAKVGDWGPVDEYRAVNVEGLRNLLEACKGQPLERFVHLSSLGVYAARHHYGTDETEPLPGSHVDGYTQSKVEAEQLALRYERELGVPVVVLRPGFIYGPRDRTVLPRLIAGLKARQVRYIGGGDKAMNCIFIGNLVEAVFLAIHHRETVGQVYNLTDGERVTKRQFLEAVADGLDLPHPKWSVPLWAARLIARWQGVLARWHVPPVGPPVTQASLKFLGLNLDFSIEKARRELGYNPRYPFEEGMKQTMAWYRQNA